VTVEEMDAGWAACIVETPVWAELFATPRECLDARESARRRQRAPGDGGGSVKGRFAPGRRGWAIALVA
jgi:hypothetical protein